MRSAASRRKRREKVQTLVLFILQTEKEMRYSDLVAMIDQCIRAKISSKSLHQLCKPLIQNGSVETLEIWDEGQMSYFWKLVDKPKLETD